MRITLIMAVALLSGCSTLGSIGDVEGLGETGEVLRAIESSRVILGGTPANSNKPAVINRTVGEARQIDNGVKDIPSTIESVKYIFDGVNSIIE